MKTIPPGSTIGILGGGQLGRMTALAAARLGYKCHIYCPDENEPAVSVSAFHTKGKFDDAAALEKFAKSVDVVTLEWENVPVTALEAVAMHTAMHPSASVLKVAQNRVMEKNYAKGFDIATTEFWPINSAAALKAALDQRGIPFVLKSTRMGYDGKGQVKVTPGMDAAAAWKGMGSDEAILEAFVDFDCEVSVIVARNADGVMAAYPAVRNIHRNHILAETHATTDIDPAVTKEADQVARLFAEKLNAVGLLAVEMFVLKKPDAKGRRILINEIAPRPHNSGHWTIDACACSQFEQLVRAVCGLPLGDTTPHSKAVMENLIGDDIKRAPKLLADKGACVHLYGKTEARPGRKMGHVTWLKGAW